MPDHSVPIPEADIWDIIDWDVVAALSMNAPTDSRDYTAEDMTAVMARALIDAGSRAGKGAELLLHKIATPWIGQGQESVRRQKAGRLAQTLGADPERFIAFVAYKWGLFRC